MFYKKASFALSITENMLAVTAAALCYTNVKDTTGQVSSVSSTDTQKFKIHNQGILHANPLSSIPLNPEH